MYNFSPLLIILKVVVFEDDCAVDVHKSHDGENPETHAKSKVLYFHAVDETQPAGEPRTAASKSKENHLLESTASHGLFEELLGTYYVPLEIWYTRTITDKVANLLSWLLFNTF